MLWFALRCESSIGYGLDDKGTAVRFSGKPMLSSFPKSPDRLRYPHRFLFNMVGIIHLGVKWPEREAGQTARLV